MTKLFTIILLSPLLLLIGSTASAQNCSGGSAPEVQTLTLTGIQSVDGLGDPDNQTGTISFSGAQDVVAYSFDNVAIDDAGLATISWCEDADIQFGGTFTVDFSTDGDLNPCPVVSAPQQNITPFATDGSGNVSWESFDSFDDAPDAPDAQYVGGTVSLYGCPTGETIVINNNNDACANAFAISDGVTAFSTVGFTGTIVSSCAGNDTNDGWYIYTASCTGNVTVSTCNDASFDTTLSVFDGCGGTELACNDDAGGCTGNTSEITFASTSGTQYWIRIAGWNGATGTGNITINCVGVGAPANDACADAIEIFSGGSETGNTSTATNVEGLAPCSGGGGGGVCGVGGEGFIDFGAGLWYKYTSSGNESITASLDNPGTNFDTELQVFSGSCGSLSCVGGDDDGGANFNSVLCWTSPSGTTDYYIYVDGHATSTGNFQLTINAVLPVELRSFTGEVLEKTNMLKWETATEVNTQMHVLERSVDGWDKWETVGEVAAVGNTSDTQYYSFEDQNPPAQSFYRLKSVDFDGYTGYSDIILLERKTDRFSVLSVYPNPTTDNVSLKFETTDDKNVNIRLTDVLGNIMSQRAIGAQAGINTAEVDLSDVPAGIYFININNGSEEITKRVVKN